MTTTNPLDGLQVTTSPEPSDFLSGKQWDFIATLIAERDVSALDPVKHEGLIEAVEDEVWDTFIGHYSKGEASQVIDALLAAPHDQIVSVEGETFDVEGGGYFGHDDRRYRIDAPTEGKWAGWIFFKTGSEYHDQQRLGSVRPSGGYRDKAEGVFRAIVADLQAAREEYARITGRCYVCNRTLEDPVSVSLGIGPVCRQGGGS